MTDFLLELRSEEIPARMQAKAAKDLAFLMGEALLHAGLPLGEAQAYATPRRLALIVRGLPLQTDAVSDELKGPRTSAPPQALEGFLRKTGLTRDALTERDGVWFATVNKPGRDTIDVLAEAIPQVIRDFPWPKSMRWGAASASTASLRWVRPLKGIVALFGEEIVPCEIAGVVAGAATLGHRFHHPGIITIGSAEDYEAKLRACHVILDPAERQAMIRDGAAAAAEAVGLALVPDEGLVAENAGLTEWPVPLLGRFDPAFLDVPREVIQLTMRTNQKYFACVDGEGKLAPAFVCTANIEASDGGAAIVAGNGRVLAARLSDARFFWEQDLRVPLEEQAAKLSGIVFHEKLGTVADKVERVAKLARWLVEEGVVPTAPKLPSTPSEVEGPSSSEAEMQRGASTALGERPSTALGMDGPALDGTERTRLADLAEQAARLAKADLVTGMVGEFPELQGVMGGYYAAAQGLDLQVAAAIRDHYKPVGQGDEVPTAPVTVAVSLADKLDTLLSFFAVSLLPTGSRDPFALRRASLGVLSLVLSNQLRRISGAGRVIGEKMYRETSQRYEQALSLLLQQQRDDVDELGMISPDDNRRASERESIWQAYRNKTDILENDIKSATLLLQDYASSYESVFPFLVDRLKVQQRDAGVRHDLIDAVFALGGEDDLVRLLARVKALQTFVETGEGRDLLAGYKRAANILKKEGWAADSPSPSPPAAAFPLPAGGERIGLAPAEVALVEALDAAEARASAAVEAEDFDGAMRALASLRAPIDAFFEGVTVNDADPAVRARRLDLLARIRSAVHGVADFSKIEG